MAKWDSTNCLIYCCRIIWKIVQRKQVNNKYEWFPFSLNIDWTTIVVDYPISQLPIKQLFLHAYIFMPTPVLMFFFFSSILMWKFFIRNFLVAKHSWKTRALTMLEFLQGKNNIVLLWTYLPQKPWILFP